MSLIGLWKELIVQCTVLMVSGNEESIMFTFIGNSLIFLLLMGFLTSVPQRISQGNTGWKIGIRVAVLLIFEDWSWLQYQDRDC